MNEPLIFEPGSVLRVAGEIVAVEHLEHFLAVAEGQAAVHAVAEFGVDGCADKVVLEEVFDHAPGVGAEDAVALEEEEVFVWG